MAQGVFGYTPEGDRVANAAIWALRDLDAIAVDPANIPKVFAAFGPEFTVLLYEFKHDLRAYLAQLTKSRVRWLGDVIRFNERHADVEMPWFCAEAEGLSCHMLEEYHDFQFPTNYGNA